MEKKWKKLRPRWRELRPRDVGQVAKLLDQRYKPDVRVVMMIKAPKGICFIFDSMVRTDSKCRAINAFMEEHKYD